MSRLNSFIRRVSAQRDCLDYAAELISGVPGPVLEIGLGNGRTYDHLRSLLPQRDIFVFDRQVNAHPDCRPDAAHMILGDFTDTLPGALDRIGAPAALAHADVGSGIEEINVVIAAFLNKTLPHLMAPDSVIISDQELKLEGWIPLALPAGVPEDRYFIIRSNGG